jgi:UDP-N-acetylmuramoylalanine-D-glutamate ligase
MCAGTTVPLIPARPDQAALQAMADRREQVVLITGGADKKCDYTGLGESM